MIGLIILAISILMTILIANASGIQDIKNEYPEHRKMKNEK